MLQVLGARLLEVGEDRGVVDVSLRIEVGVADFNRMGEAKGGHPMSAAARARGLGSRSSPSLEQEMVDRLTRRREGSHQVPVADDIPRSACRKHRPEGTV